MCHMLSTFQVTCRSLLSKILLLALPYLNNLDTSIPADKHISMKSIVSVMDEHNYIKIQFSFVEMASAEAGKISRKRLEAPGSFTNYNTSEKMFIAKKLPGECQIPL